MSSTMLIISCIIIAVLILIFLTIKVKLHPFFALTVAAISFGLMTGHNINDIMTSYSTGLGGTISGIGIVIAIGTVMGALLEKSGAVETMAQTILRITGKNMLRLDWLQQDTLFQFLYFVIQRMSCYLL